MGEMQISKKAFDEMQEKLKFRISVKRKEIQKAIAEAREHGDLKENSAYTYAKQEQSMNETMIQELEEKLKNVKVVEKRIKQNDFVDMESVVKLKNTKSGEILEYTVVSEMESNILEDKISDTSPLGKALMYSKKGEVVSFEAPVGTIEYKIMEIK